MLLFPISSVFSLMRKIIPYSSHMPMQCIVVYNIHVCTSTVMYANG